MVYRAFANGPAEYRAWWNTIQHTHRRRIRLIVMTLEHDTLSELTTRFVAGQVTFDRDRVPTRVAEITVLDPQRMIRFEPDAPTDAPVYRNRMVQIRYEVLVPAGGHGPARWFSVPVITGPIEDFDRTGATVRLIVNGKEVLAGEAGAGRTFAKKANKARVIETLLRDAGENRMRIPARRGRLPKRLVVTRTDSRWAKARRLAASMDDQLTYNGPGTAVMTRRGGRPGLTVGKMLLLGEVTIDRGSDSGAGGGGAGEGADRRNRWEVTGGVPKGTRHKPKARVDLPAKHPMSARSQGRNGKLRHLGRYVENPHVKTRAAALRLAQRMRDSDLRQTVAFSCETLPIPNLEEGDVARLLTDDGYVQAPLNQWTLPLDDGPMTLGALRRTRTSGPTRGASRTWWLNLPRKKKSKKHGGRGHGGGRGGSGGRSGGKGGKG